MPEEDNKAVIRRYIDVINRREWARLPEFVSPDYFETGDQPGGSKGPSKAKEHLLGVTHTFPDLQLTVDLQIAEGDWVVTRVKARATHLGAWMQIKPTGKVLELTGINLDRVVGGRIVEHGGVADMLRPLLKAGAVHA